MEQPGQIQWKSSNPTRRIPAGQGPRITRKVGNNPSINYVLTTDPENNAQAETTA